MRSEHHVAGASATHAVGGPLNVVAAAQPPQAHRPDGRRRSRARLPARPRLQRRLRRTASAWSRRRRAEGRRWSAADAFLRRAPSRPNLTVATGTSAIGLEIKGGRATGVRLAGRAPFATARAREEIDPRRRRDRLAAAPDAVRRSATRRSSPRPTSRRRSTCPAVGQNLQDHPYVGLDLGVVDRALAARRREADRGRSSGCSRRTRPAHLDRLRGVHLHPLRRLRRPARPPVPPRAGVLLAERLRGARRARADDGPGAGRAARRAASCACAAPTRPRSRAWSATT